MKTAAFVYIVSHQKCNYKKKKRNNQQTLSPNARRATHL